MKPQKVPLYELNLPQYDVSRELSSEDYKVIGSKIDEVIKKHYSGKDIVLRSISSSMKKGSIDDVVTQIQQRGTDYVVEGKKFKVSDDWKKDAKADLFGAGVKVSDESEMIYRAIKAFYELPKDDEGKPMPQKADIIMIYDASKLEQITYRSKNSGKLKKDAYNFLSPKQKQEALIGIIKIN